MIRQYFANPRQGGSNPLGIGVIPIGATYYLQDNEFFHARYGGRAVCRNPWQVEAFLNGIVAAGRRNEETGKWEDVFISHRSDMAIVRSLRDGRRCRIAVRLLILHDELGLAREPTAYPTLPDIRFYRSR